MKKFSKTTWWVVGGGALLVVVVILFFIFSGNSVRVVGTEAVVVRSQPGEYQPGQVIVFRMRGSDALITGYIVAIEANGVYRTQRGAADTSDTQLVEEDQIIGQKVFSVPGAGWVITQVQAITKAVASGLSAVWQALFGSEPPVPGTGPSVGDDSESPEASVTLLPTTTTVAPTAPTATPTPVVATPTPKPAASPTPTPTSTPTPTAFSQPGSSVAPISQEEINAGILTLPAPSPTP